MSGLDMLPERDVSAIVSLALVLCSPLLPLAGSRSTFAAHCDHNTDTVDVGLHRVIINVLTGCSMTLSSVSEQGISPR